MKKSEEELNNFFELALDLLGMASSDGYFKRVNPAVKEILGYTPEEFCAKPYLSFVHPDDFEKTKKEVEKLELGLPTIAFENRYLCKNGSYKWLWWKVTPAAGLLYCDARDMTSLKIREKEIRDLNADLERKAAERTEQFQKSEAQLRLITDALPALISYLDADTCYKFSNLAYKNWFGLEEGDILGKPLREVIGEKGFKAVEECVQKALAGQFVQFERTLSYIHGGTRDVLVSYIPDRGTKGEVRGFVALVTDITDRNREQLERARLFANEKAAIETARTKSEFLANMSHEIRTPLNGIIGMTDLLLDGELDAQQQRYAQIVQKSGNNLLKIVNDILDFSQIEAGKLNLEIIDFSPLTLVESQTELLLSQVTEKGLSLMTYIDPKIPDLLRGDPGRIAQILINLIGNAIKFTKVGSVVVRATLKSSTAEEVIVHFSVTDTGIGLPSEACDRLFQPFTQADNSTARKYGGTGLGLSISKRLTELMGGSIGIEGTEGKGSTFWFTTRLISAFSPNLPGVSAETDMSGLRVLVVDDDHPAGEIISYYLQNWKIQTKLVKGGTEALSALRIAAAAQVPFDIVIIDKRMPVMDGFNLAQTIKSDPQISLTQLILTTAFDRDSQSEMALKPSFSGYLTKPIQRAELYKVIKSAMGAIESLKNSNVKQVGSENSTEQESLSSRKRILVAEDNTVNQLYAVTLLKKWGFAAHAVADGREAFEAVTQGAYDLILMDCQMPEMDGYEASRAIRDWEKKSGQHIPIIALTANAMKEDEEKCLQSGMDDYISKPINKKKLADALQKWLSSAANLKS
jgi:two-component system sensor histidine kinase/response regulator